MSLELAAFRQYIDGLAMSQSQRIMLREFANNWEANLKQIPEKDVLKARREDIAKHAMAGIMANSSLSDQVWLDSSKCALKLADALITELDK